MAPKMYQKSSRIQVNVYEFDQEINLKAFYYHQLVVGSWRQRAKKGYTTAPFLKLHLQ